MVAEQAVNKKIENGVEVRNSLDLYPASISTIGGIRWGYINRSGTFSIPPKFTEAADFQENGLAIVKEQGMVGLIDSLGIYQIPPIYEIISPFIEKRAVLLDKQGFKIIDDAGKVKTLRTYEYIGNYHNGRAKFADTTADGDYLFGYLDLNGVEIIPNIFQSGSDFTEGKAVVKVQENEFALIDVNGRKLTIFPYPFVGNAGGGLVPFQDTVSKMFGYLYEDGRIAIPAAFSGAQHFVNRRAVVSLEDGVYQRYGLIDQGGRYLVPPDYNEIILLGENRVAVGKAIDTANPLKGSRLAIADINGRMLTNFLYFGVAEFQGNLASAYGQHETFFIDLDGKRVGTLPSVSGSGKLSLVNGLVKADVDHLVSYYHRDGRVVWEQNKAVLLKDQLLLLQEKYRPNKDFLVYYPQVLQLNQFVQAKINGKFRAVSDLRPLPSDVQLDYSYYGNFAIEFFKKNLLVLELNSYEYSFGAAHGMPTRRNVHIDLVTGHFFELKDLFKKNVSYVKVLGDMIGNQIKHNQRYSYVFPGAFKGIKPDQPFYVGESSLSLYFSPDKIAPFAAGLPTFTIPYVKFWNLIDLNGAFWRSFHS